MGIQKRALENAANTTAASRFAAKDYMGGQTITTIPFDKFPKWRYIAVDVAPWLFVAHMNHCFDVDAFAFSVTKLKRAVMVPEVWAAMLVTRASFITIPYEVASVLAGLPAGSSRVALLFDNDYSVPGSGRKYLEHIYRDLHKSASDAPLQQVAIAIPEQDEAESAGSNSGSSTQEGDAGADVDDCVPSPVAADFGTGGGGGVVDIDWERFHQYAVQFNIGAAAAEAAAAGFVRSSAGAEQPSKRGQRYEFYASVLACLESGAIPPLVGQLLVDDGRDDCYRSISPAAATAADIAKGRRVHVRVRHVPAGVTVAHLSAAVVSDPTPAVNGIHLNCYGIVYALQKQREALVAALRPLIGQGLLTDARAIEISSANLRYVALMFKSALGEEVCRELADEVTRCAFAWITGAGATADQAETRRAGCKAVQRGAPPCPEGERLALLFIHRWATDHAEDELALNSRSVFMCEDSDGPMMALQLLAPHICRQHAAKVAGCDNDRAITVMRYRQGTYEELDFAFMAERLATQIADALSQGLNRFHERQPGGSSTACSRQAIWRRATELVSLVAAMMFFVGSDYVQDVHRLVPDFPASVHPTRLTRAIMRTVCMVAELEGPSVLCDDHSLYISSQNGKTRSSLLLQPQGDDGVRGASPALCALVLAVMLAEEQVHGTRFRCGDKNPGTVPKRHPPSGRLRRRPTVMPSGSLTLCRQEMRFARRLFPSLVGCSPAECGLQTGKKKKQQPHKPPPPKKKTRAKSAAAAVADDCAADDGRIPSLDARALVYACPYKYPLAAAAADPSPLLSTGSQTSGKRKREGGGDEPAAKRPKRAPAPMQTLKVPAGKFALYRKFAAAVGSIPGCSGTVRRFAVAGLRTGKRPAKKKLGALPLVERLAAIAVLRGQLARLVCEDWLLHAYVQEGRLLDCTARTADGDPVYGYSRLLQGGETDDKVREKMILEWPRRVLVDGESMQSVRACLRGYRDTGY